jgi:hypothetical protein
MWPVLGGLIAGGGSLLSGIFSSNTSASNTSANIAAQQQAQNQSEAFNSEQAGINRAFNSEQAILGRNFNAEQSQINRDFQDTMSSTAYQRASKDMTAAGLNPMMMFGSGSAASTPSGSAASGPTASGSAASVGTPNMALHNNTSAMAGLGAAAERGLNSAINVKTIEKMTDEIANLRETNSKIIAEREATHASESLTQQKTRTEEAETDKSRIDAKLKALGVPSAEFSAREAKSRNDLPDWAVTAAQQGGYYGDMIKKGFDTISSIPGVDILKKAFRDQESSSANAVRRGMDIERNFDKFYRN